MTKMHSLAIYGTSVYCFLGGMSAAPRCYVSSPVRSGAFGEPFVVGSQSRVLVLFSEAFQHVLEVLWVQEIVVSDKEAAG